jgi:uncharacterized membrane protein
MPSILLINGNKIVSRLLQLSSEKHGYDLEIGETFNPSESSYNVVFVDSDQYSEELSAQIKEKLKFDKLGYIGAKHSELPAGFDLLLEKPFLPTDFITLMDANFKVVDPMDLSDNVAAEKELEDNFELDELDMEAPDEELASFDDLEAPRSLSEDSLDFEDDLDLDLEDTKASELDDDLVIPDAIGAAMTTGIAATVLSSGDSNAQELAGMVDDIDDMVIDEDDQKFLSDISSSLDEESDLLEEDLSGEIEELTEGIEENLDVPDFTELTQNEDEKEELSELLDPTPSNVDGELMDEPHADLLDKESIKEVVEEKSSIDISDAAIGAAVAATSAAVVNEVIASDKKDEVSDELEDIVTQNDRVKEKVEEKLDISNLEKIIEAAVSKALTPDKLREALSGMDIGFSINSKNSDS